MACAIAIFVPTPSVEVARSGLLHAQQRRRVNYGESAGRAEHGGRDGGDGAFISSTARSPAAVSTPKRSRSHGVSVTVVLFRGWALDEAMSG